MARSTGEIVAKDSILIGESADVTAQIMATSIIVAGNVKGDIIGTQRIELRPSAKVLGKLTEPNLGAQGCDVRGLLRDATGEAVRGSKGHRVSHG